MPTKRSIAEYLGRDTASADLTEHFADRYTASAKSLYVRFFEPVGTPAAEKLLAEARGDFVIGWTAAARPGNPLDAAVAGAAHVSRSLVAFAKRLAGLYRAAKQIPAGVAGSAVSQLWVETAYIASYRNLSEPYKTAWLLSKYLGLTPDECPHLGLTARTFAEHVSNAGERVNTIHDKARRSADLGPDAAQVKQHVADVFNSVWQLHYGLVTDQFTTLTRDAVEARLFEGRSPRWDHRATYFVEFARVAASYRRGVCARIIGGSDKDPAVRRLRGQAVREQARATNLSQAREALSGTAGVADEWFALTSEALLAAESVSVLSGHPADRVQSVTDSYRAELDHWAAHRGSGPRGG